MCFTCRQYACSCMHSTTARWKLGCMCVYDSVFVLGGVIQLQHAVMLTVVLYC